MKLPPLGCINMLPVYRNGAQVDDVVLAYQAPSLLIEFDSSYLILT
jgi:hypothetical protein